MTKEFIRFRGKVVDKTIRVADIKDFLFVRLKTKEDENNSCDCYWILEVSNKGGKLNDDSLNDHVIYISSIEIWEKFIENPELVIINDLSAYSTDDPEENKKKVKEFKIEFNKVYKKLVRLQKELLKDNVEEIMI